MRILWPRILQSQRDCVTKPGVARNELPWVHQPDRLQPQRGCVTLPPLNHDPAWGSSSAVVAWGYNSSGQTSVPSTLSDVTAIAAGHSHSLALNNDGIVVAWGNNFNHQITVPLELADVVAIAAGGFHSLALKAD